jgi:hypothetical protein
MPMRSLPWLADTSRRYEILLLEIFPGTEIFLFVSQPFLIPLIKLPVTFAPAPLLMFLFV